MELLIALIITLFLTIYLFFKRSFVYWKRIGVPQVKPTIPYGNAKDVIWRKLSMGENIHRLYKILKASGRRFAGVYFFTKPELIILDPELVKHVLSKDFTHFSNRGTQYDEKNDPLSAHLFNLKGNAWKIIRQKVTPTFSSGKIKTMFHTVEACSQKLSEVLNNHSDNNEPIDIKEISGHFTTDIIGSCAFGLECNSLKNPDNEFRKWGKRVFELTTYLWFKRLIGFVSPKVNNFFGFTKFDPGVDHFFRTIIKNTVEYREKNNYKRDDFLQLLINVRNSVEESDENRKEKNNVNEKTHHKQLSLDQIAAQSFVFFLAGFETSSTTMMFFFYDLAVNQDVQEKVRNEINEMFLKYNGKLTYEGVLELQYLDKVINESMRLHSAIPIILRRCTKDYKIPDSDVIIKKGINVLIPVIGLQSDPEYYPNPEMFDPERFSQEEKEKRHPCTFLPFGEGPRKCIGIRFGLLQTKVGIITLLKNHRFTLNKKTKVPIEFESNIFLLSVKGGVWLNAEKI